MTRIAAVLALLLGLAAPALAQVQGGTVAGTIRDEQGAVLPGAEVTISGPAERLSFVTGDDGQFRFLNVAPGTYTITASLSGFATIVREGIRVVVGQTVELPFVMRVASLQESVTVSGESPIVDTHKLGTATNFTQDELARIPNSRDPWALLRTVPGIVVDRINIAGNETGQQSNYSGKGTLGNQSTWTMDGVVITDMSATGASPTYFDYDAFEEIQISTSNHDVRQPTSGIGLNMVVKRGTNQFRGTGRAYFTNDALESENVPDELLARGITPQTADHNEQIADYGFDLGGPIVRDKAWVWGSWTKQDIRLGRQAGRLIDRTVLKTTNVKGNWQATGSDMVSILYFNGGKEKFGRGTGQAQREAETATWNQGNYYPEGRPHGLLKFQDDRVLTPTLFLSAKYAYYGTGFSLSPRGGLDGQTTRDAVNSTTLGTTRGLYFLRPQHIFNVDGNTFQNALGGSHDLKYGVGYRTAEAFSQTIWPGDKIQGRIESATNRIGRLFREGAGNDKTRYFSAYVGDTFSRGRVTLDVGVRYDRQWGSALPSETESNGAFPDKVPGIVFAGYDSPFTWNDVTPRAGVTYQLDESGRTLLRGSIGQYVGQLGNGTVGFSNPSSQVGFADYPWVGDLNGNGFADPEEIDTSAAPSSFGGGFNPLAPTSVSSADRIDPNLKAPRTTAATLGIDRELMPNLALSVAYSWNRTTRYAYDPWIGVGPEDYELADTAATPGGQLTGTIPGGGSFSALVYRPIPERVAEGGNGRIRTNFEGYSTRYQGLDFTLTKRLSNRWMARVAAAFNHATQHYDASNLVGGFGNPTPNDGYIDSIVLGTPVPQSNAIIDGGQMYQLSSGSGQGEVFINAKWMLNMNALYQLPWGMEIAANVYGKQGSPLPPVVPASLGLDGSHNVLVVSEIDAVRLDDVWNLDLRLAKAIRMARGHVNLVADLFNVFNNNVELQRNRVIGGTFNQLNQNLSPRILRFGVRVGF
ncbi:MAG TPA: TonB-dependent receptor [Vicinamibacterales bacterium]|nr:TonB-dependent receptor [Vicinamibacterales bacterium]